MANTHRGNISYNCLLPQAKLIPELKIKYKMMFLNYLVTLDRFPDCSKLQLEAKVKEIAEKQGNSWRLRQKAIVGDIPSMSISQEQSS